MTGSFAADKATPSMRNILLSERGRIYMCRNCNNNSRCGCARNNSNTNAFSNGSNCCEDSTNISNITCQEAVNLIQNQQALQNAGCDIIRPIHPCTSNAVSGCGCTDCNCSGIPVCCDGENCPVQTIRRICCNPDGNCAAYPEDCRNRFWPDFSHPRWLCCEDLYCNR